MIENIQLTRKILEYVAEAPNFPAGITIEALEEAIPREPDDPPGDHVRHRSRLTYHVVLACDAGLLKMGEYEVEGSGSVRPSYYIDQIDGLSVAGCNYVRYAQSNLWHNALELFAKEGAKATTAEMAKVLLKLATSKFAALIDVQ